MKKVALYPGTFDPVTNGHFDIIQRSLEIFDHVIVGVAHNPQKSPLFSVEERVKMLKEVTRDLDRIEEAGSSYRTDAGGRQTLD